MANWVDEELDIRSQWLGVKRLKQGYNPRRYTRNDKHGNNISRAEQAEATANYQATRHWAQNNQEHLALAKFFAVLMLSHEQSKLVCFGHFSMPRHRGP